MDENLPPGGAPSIPPSPKPPENTAPNEISSAPAPTSEPLQGTASTPIASSALPPVATPPVVNTPLPEAPPPPPPPFTTAPPPPPQFSAPHSPPPPPRTPPPIFIAQPAPSSGKGWFWKVFAILMFLGLGATLLVIFNLFTGSAGSSNRSVHQKRQHLEEITLEENHSDDKIVIISIEGVISSQDQNRRGDNMVEDVRRQFKAARKDPDVRAVILKVNSPGGEVLASDEIFNMVDTFQQETGKPVIASMHTLAASGGYYVSAPCRWIVANELTITGSIGVIMQGLNFSGLMEKVGLQTETYKSGEHKDMLSPFRRKDEIPEEERKMVQGLITETYGKFTNIVETGRSEAFRANSKMKEKGQSLDESWANYADGRVLSGRQAYELGFVDELGDFRTAVDRAETIAKISKANLIEYQQPFDLGDLFSIFGQTESRAIKVDLGVDFPKLQPGCLYFLYRQAVP